MEAVNGPRMIINELNRVVSVPEAATVAVLQHLIVRAVVRMALPLRQAQMAMAQPPIWVRCLHPPAVYSIPHQVSIAIV